jgi:putative FmdB family regulatory protein
MPTYQYECDGCGHAFEMFQSMLDKKLKKCPECGKNELHRLIGGGSGIIFKGSGFYETDYKKKESSKGSSEAGGDGAKCPLADSKGCKGCE